MNKRGLQRSETVRRERAYAGSASERTILVRLTRRLNRDPCRDGAGPRLGQSFGIFRPRNIPLGLSRKFIDLVEQTLARLTPYSRCVELGSSDIGGGTRNASGWSKVFR